MAEGLFITVEGIDGAGKTTAVEAINEHYKRVVRTQEPSSEWTGPIVRDCISNDTEQIHPFVTFYAFMMDRVQHIENTIKPGVEDGMIVVSDRYADSTLAYQPVALNSHLQRPQRYMESTMRPWNYEPDLTIYLDIPVETAVERVDGTEEYETGEFLAQVRENYERLARRFDDRYVQVDGTQMKEQVRQDVLNIVEEYT